MGSDLIRDARHALRSARLNGAFFATSVLIIALGVGASTAIFSVVNPLLLRSLPFEQPDRLVWIANNGSTGLSSVTSRTSNLRDLRRLSRLFEQISGYNAFFDYDRYNLTGTGEPERIVGVPVAHDFLDLLGVQPARGRSFLAEEAMDDELSEAIVLSHGAWQGRFGGDPEVVGRALSLNGVPVTVVGVLPESFDFGSFFAPGSRIDFLWPFPIDDETDRQGNTMNMIGRLSDGATVEEAQGELDLILARLRQEDPDRWGIEGAVVADLHDKITGRFAPAMLLLAGAAGLLLLIVCANLSNLLLARASARRREIAVRSAMGASRGRLVRQLLTESLVMSGLGAVVGIGLAFAIARTVATATAVSVPLLRGVAIDGAALLFTIGVALVAGLLFGLVPALQLSTGGEGARLTDSSRGTSEGRRGAWVREALVVSEVALACVLLIGSGLLLRSFFAVLEVELGFEAAGAVAWRIDSVRRFESGAERLAFYDQIAQEAAAIPGVTAVGLADTLPLGRNREWGIRVPGVDYGDEGNPAAFPRLIDRGYLDAMRIPIVAGRGFRPTDTAESELVILINETLARNLYPGQDPLGQALSTAGTEFRVVGVVRDVRHSSLEEAAGNEMYIVIDQRRWYSTLDLVVRSDLPLSSYAGAVSAILRRADPDMPAGESRTLGEIVDRAVSPRRFVLLLIQAFAAASLLLACLGIYGVLSYSVSRQAQEMGIRLALRASAAELRRRVLRRTLTLAGFGIVLGWFGAILLGRLIGSLLFGVPPTDPQTYGVVTVIVVAIAAAAGYLPARRASRVDPMEVLAS